MKTRQTGMVLAALLAGAVLVHGNSKSSPLVQIVGFLRENASARLVYTNSPAYPGQMVLRNTQDLRSSNTVWNVCATNVYQAQPGKNLDSFVVPLDGASRFYQIQYQITQP